MESSLQLDSFHAASHKALMMIIVQSVDLVNGHSSIII